MTISQYVKAQPTNVLRSITRDPSRHIDIRTAAAREAERRVRPARNWFRQA